MCGRFTLHSRERILLRGSQIVNLPFEARFNIAPSQQIPVIADFGSGPEVKLMVWGLIPSWSTDGKGFINARSETLEEKPSFSESFRLRRCLIPADGFFEWKKSGGLKQPYYLTSQSEFGFGGIWDRWKNGQETILSCAIITTPANDLVSQLHNRMPAMLLPDSYDLWLDRRSQVSELKKLLIPFETSNMSSHPINTAINHPENDNKELIERVDAGVGMTPTLF